MSQSHLRQEKTANDDARKSQETIMKHGKENARRQNGRELNKLCKEKRT